MMSLIMVLTFSLAACERPGGVGSTTPIKIVQEKESSAQVVHVGDFGAKPGTMDDSGPAIRQSFEAAIKMGPGTEIRFAEGTYRLGGVSRSGHWGPRVALYIEGAAKLTIKGTPHTRLVITDPETAALVLHRCEDVSVSDLQIDYDPVPYAQGTIAAVDLDNQTFDLRLEEGGQFLDFNNPAYQRAKSVMGYTVRQNGSESAIYGPIVIGAEPVNEVTPKVWRLRINPKLPFGTFNKYAGYPEALRRSKLAVGDRYIHWARAYIAAVSLVESNQITCRNLKVYASPGLAFFPYLSSNVKLDHCAVEILPKSSRLISTNADGVHARGMRGPLTVQNCRFEGMGDDAINIHSSAIRPLKRISSRELLCDAHTFTIRGGDMLEYLDVDGKSGQSYEVQEAKITSEGWQVTFVEELPATLNVSEKRILFYNLSEAGKGFLFQNNYFGPHRGRGILVSATDGEIRDNTFSNREVGSGWAIVLHHEASIWAEGPIARRIRIEENRFEGLGGNEPAIKIYPMGSKRSGDDTSVWYADIVIQNNRFEKLTGPAAVINQVQNLSLIGNRVVRTGAVAVPTPPFSAAFQIKNCPGATVEGNQLEDAGFSALFTNDSIAK
ncbi:MAG: hypothetical protein B9S32_14585 [Verrucomicrobia bacterium Tous-C9LFEB]|nr:MAG: hypothetical protein B9S32_14585 [Verrucomicrobia bacterium Tous-C9LFEB]